MAENGYQSLQVCGRYNVPPYAPGLRFDPTDEELIVYYLSPKVCGSRLPCNLIVNIDLYNYHPKELLGKMSFPSDRNPWYLFTSRNRKYPNGGRPNRSAGSGYWKATGSDQLIATKNGRSIGYKKSLVFHEGRQPSKNKTGWMMCEYRIDESNNPANPANKTMLLDNWVLCKIYCKQFALSGGSKDDGTAENDNSRMETTKENALVALNSEMLQEEIIEENLLDVLNFEMLQESFPNLPNHFDMDLV